MSDSYNSASALLPDTSDKEFGKLRWMNWWYRLSLPPKPTESDPFEKQDIYRRARLASTLLFLLLIIMVCGTLISAISLNFNNMVVTGIITVILIGCVILNRSGRLIIEGILIVGLWTVGIVLSFVSQPTMSIGTVIQYDLLSVAILLAVTFFPTWSVFIITAFNSFFVIWSLNNLSYDGPLKALVEKEGLGRVATRPISLMVVIMVITYLWARSSQHALQRADRAETIAKFQYDLAERDQAIATQKTLLEHSIQKIVETLTQYSNGNLGSRVPLTQDNVLWNVAGSINNLLNRVQRMRHAEVELERMRPLLQHARQLERENATLRATIQKQANNAQAHNQLNFPNGIKQEPF